MRLALFALLSASLAGCAVLGNGTESAPAVAHAFSGVANARLGAATATTHNVTVPAGAVGLNATLTWSDTAARLTLTVAGPRGAPAPRAIQEGPGRLALGTPQAPEAGTWTFYVGASQATNATYDLVAWVEPAWPAANDARGEVDLAPRRYVEVNVQLREDDKLSYAFEAAAPLTWDVHTHAGERVNMWANGKDAKVEQAFTATEPGTYSFYVKNDGATPAHLKYSATGPFRLLSHVRGT